ncbi:MAG: hypothetical protein JRI65_07795 [Deltaproteobacteria bacterium]|nr:hypothetical protein [Deltaproteobacteria bacterium]
MKKRISRHMQHLGCRTIQGYFSALDRNEDARQDCERLMTVSISRFFRDRGLWQFLENEILPAIIKENRHTVKCWSAGCACGEEVYSLKILWHTLSGHLQPLPELEIWATDMDPVYLNKARAGIYPRSSLKEVPEALRKIYFRPQAKGRFYAVCDPLKKQVVWRVHNLFFDPPGRKEPAFQKVLDSLAQGGFLIIGSHEKIPPGARGLLLFGHHPYIFQKEA